MLKSMTGFGRFECYENGLRVTVEMKSVNHRYCEVSVRIPKMLNFFESGVRNLIKKYVSRGKIDVSLTYEDETVGAQSVRYNREVAAEYVKYMKQMIDEFQLSPDISVTSLARMQDVLVYDETGMDEEKIWSVVEKAVNGACERFVASRVAEGEHLRKDIFAKLDGMLDDVAAVEVRSPQIVSEYRAKLLAKIQEVMGDAKVDPQVLASELVIFADRICTDEETVRLRAHIESMKDTLTVAENIGRKLDFIAQEMNREANTILSKANDMEVSQIAIRLKTEIEKIREQIQNIE